MYICIYVLNVYMYIYEYSEYIYIYTEYVLICIYVYWMNNNMNEIHIYSNSINNIL
jgi:hypothetical protein